MTGAGRRNFPPAPGFWQTTMRRAHLARLLTIAAALAATWAIAPAAAAAPARGVVTLTSCTTGEDPASRAAVFAATVTRGSRASRVAVRFRLIRTPVPVAADGPPQAAAPAAALVVTRAVWTSWKRSAAGVGALIATRRVDRLTGPATYTVLVDMRWYNRRGRVIKRQQTRSAACRQPTYRPDLTVAVDGSAGAALSVSVGNSGTIASRPTRLTATIGGAPAGSVEIPAITAGGSVVAGLTLTPCSGPAQAVLTIEAADPELSLANNSTVAAVTCPAA